MHTESEIYQRLLDARMSRRQALSVAAASVGGLTLASVIAACGGNQAGTPSSTPSSKTVRVAIPNGPVSMGIVNAFIQPFSASTGIQATQITAPDDEGQKAAMVKAMVETGSYDWDLVQIEKGAYYPMHDQGITDSMGLNKYNFHLSDMVKGSIIDPDYVATYIPGSVLAYRTDKFQGTDVPRNWADFWNVDKFPGRRAIYKDAESILDVAVLSSGVSPSNLYPLDVDLAFKQLDKIKPHVTLWYESTAQSTQALHDGTIDLGFFFNGRAQTAIDAGAPAKISWDQWLATMAGWVIPKGAPNADNARQLMAYMTDPKQQAVFTKYIKYGGTNLKSSSFADPATAGELPGSPNTLPGMILVDEEWWGKNYSSVLDRFNAWLAS